MVNGLGVLGWGVGGIEAEAAMLGQPLSMLVPPVVGLRLTGELPEGTTATDLVLTIDRAAAPPRRGRASSSSSRSGAGRASGSRTGRRSATWHPSTAPPAPSSRSTTSPSTTCASPAASGRTSALVETYAKEQGLFHEPRSPSRVLRVARRSTSPTVEPSLAGPLGPRTGSPSRARSRASELRWHRRCRTRRGAPSLRVVPTRVDGDPAHRGRPTATS